mmetsp:Transcript_6487/g.13848  ORF Transcript_6487/g.13848 Transcript_6487/m.13848 type:complete len:342 (+) Transcript_6487:97-1122(+)
MEAGASAGRMQGERLLELDCGGGGELMPLVIPASVVNSRRLDLMSQASWAYDLLQLPNASLRYELRDALYLAWMLSQRGSYLTEVDIRELHAWLNEFYALLRAYFSVHLDHIFAALKPHVSEQQLPPPLRTAARMQTENAVLRTTTAMLGAHSRVMSGALSADHAILQIQQQLMAVCALVVKLCDTVESQVLAPSLATVLTAEQGVALESRIFTALLEQPVPKSNVAATLARARWATSDQRALAAWRKQVVKPKHTRSWEHALHWLQRTHIARLAAVNRRIRVFFSADIQLPTVAQIETRDRVARRAALAQLEEFNQSLQKQGEHSDSKKNKLFRKFSMSQ